MSAARRWLIALLTLLAVILIGVNVTSRQPDLTRAPASYQPAYQSGIARTLAYDPQGALSYQLLAQQVRYYSDSETSWFKQPVMTIYDSTHQPAWSIKADDARLTQKKTLYLHGHVQITALAPNAQLREINTDNARVDLPGLDIASDDRVTLSGPGLSSSGLKMRGNLRDKTARLLEQVKTSYDTKNIHPAP